MTRNGLDLALRYREARPEGLTIYGPREVVGSPIPGHTSSALFFETAEHGIQGWSGPLRSVIPSLWSSHDSIIATMDLGIVARLVGKQASDKRKDPAAVVLDDAGKFAISVPGGHAAGANSLTEDLAAIFGAQAVITTASEVSRLPSVDQIGREFGWLIENAQNLTKVAASVIRRNRVAVWQDAGNGNW